MYVCLDCGNLFYEPKLYIEIHGLDSPPYEKLYGCPLCGGAYYKTFKCDGCGEWITNEYVEILPSHDVYCENCFDVKNIDD